MKVIEKWYEKLLGYDWHYRLRARYTLFEVLFIIAAAVFIAWWLYDWLVMEIL